jgi:TolA-binding protein
MENQCEEAQTLYQKVIDQYPQSAHRIRAQFGRANCMEELGNFKQALVLYQELLDRYPSKPVIEMKIKNLQRRLQDLTPEKTPLH